MASAAASNSTDLDKKKVINNKYWKRHMPMAWTPLSVRAALYKMKFVANMFSIDSSAYSPMELLEASKI
jgi:hypothetical protein